MLTREGDLRSPAADLRLAALLSGVAGAVNAAGFQATGFFSANMTGNASLLSDRLGLGQIGPATFLLSLIVVFIAGAFGSGLLVETGCRRGVRAISAYGILLEAVLLALVGLLDLGLPASGHGPFLALGLSAIMSLQNAASSRISQARVRTTHVSGMATDIGLGLAALLISPPDRPAALARLRLYGVSLLCFVLAGLAGVLVSVRTGGWVFVLAALILALPAALQMRAARRS